MACETPVNDGRRRSPEAPGDRNIEAAIGSCAGGASITVRVIPRAGSSQIAGVRNGALLMRLAAAPLEGAANEALVSLLARILQIAPRNITIAAGHHSRNKRVVVQGMDPSTLREKLSRAFQGN